jgi:Methyltransferase domain
MPNVPDNALEQFDGLMPTEVDVLKELVRTSNARAALEIGMARASSTVAILSALPSDGHLTSIDPFQLREQDGYGGAGVRVVQQAGLAVRHTLLAEYDYVALPRLVEQGCRFEFVFIDGYHAFDYAMLDFFYANLLVPPDGIIAFHDSGWPSIYRVCQFVEHNVGYTRIGPPPALAGLHWSRRGARLAWSKLVGRGSESDERRFRYKSVAAYRKRRTSGSLEDDNIDRYRLLEQ